MKGIPGRGNNGYGRMLRDWLACAQTWLGEPVEVEYIDHPQDHGVDVLVTGLVTASRIGIQIKSDKDLKSATFQRELKAQVTESQALGVEELVVIFGCDPYPPNEARIQHFVMESRRYQRPHLVVIPPERAAGLLTVFSKPLVEPHDESRPWTTFFDDVGQSALIGLYLDRWHPLSPDDRFVAPECFQDVKESIATYPVTCLVGPPATGKTFLAALLAHRHWLAGKTVSWIAPPTHQLTEGPMSLSTGLPDARQRVDFLSRQLGLRERHPPLDPTEFVAKHFLPQSLVYIEDPFGKTPAEFTTSLHTYPFFDLDAFLTLLAGAARASARVLVTSREGLFERWLRESGKGIDARVNVVRLQSGSYSFQDRVDLANKLARVQRNTLSSEIVEHIARQLETPFEVEQCVHALPQDATDEQARAAAEAARHLSLASATSLVRPETDADRLFLLCLCAQTRSTAGRDYFSRTYEELFALLALNGSAATALESAMAKYESVVTRTPIGDKINPAGVHLDPVHSTVLERRTH
ncbi:hypothetical protein [Sorangium sp. So ce124]|uniref:hypothetical protein n=1 Tax=Sorangium sp. So ce124 TaxID=3133280 RepID=UPI003F61ACDB